MLNKENYRQSKFKNPLITVITVVRNGEDTLEKTILSVINQTYTNIEYIIIDGASTDSTLKIIKKYNDKITYWTSEPDNGIYDAMNKGIEISTGEWINFMNAGDTFYNENVITNILHYLNSDFDIVFGLRNNQKRKKKINVNWWFLFKNMGICHQTIFSRKNCLLEKFDLRYRIASDFNWILSVYSNEAKFKFVDIIIVNYDSNGISKKEVKLTQNEFKKILCLHFPYIMVLIRTILWRIKSFKN